MPYCCVAGCLPSHFDKKRKRHFFSFPKDPSRRQLWVTKVGRKDFTPDNRLFVCDVHFDEKFIITYDSIINKDGKIVQKRKRPKLTKDAYPFDCSQYVLCGDTRPLVADCKITTLPDKIKVFKEKENKPLIAKEDLIKDFDNFIQNFQQHLTRTNQWIFRSIHSENNGKNCQFLSLYGIQDDAISKPCMTTAMRVSEDLTVEVFVDSNKTKLVPLPDHELRSLLKSSGPPKLCLWWHFETLLSYCSQEVRDTREQRDVLLHKTDNPPHSDAGSSDLPRQADMDKCAGEKENSIPKQTQACEVPKSSVFTVAPSVTSSKTRQKPKEQKGGDNDNEQTVEAPGQQQRKKIVTDSDSEISCKVSDVCTQAETSMENVDPQLWSEYKIHVKNVLKETDCDAKVTEDVVSKIAVLLLKGMLKTEKQLYSLLEEEHAVHFNDGDDFIMGSTLEPSSPVVSNDKSTQNMCVDENDEAAAEEPAVIFVNAAEDKEFPEADEQAISQGENGESLESSDSEQLRRVVTVNGSLPRDDTVAEIEGNESTFKPPFQNLAVQDHPYASLPDRPFYCNICQKYFPTRFSLKIHIRKVHTKERPYKCHMCEKAFYMNYELTVHLKRHNIERPYACKICCQSFKTRQNLSCHVSMLHSNRTNSYECSTCGSCFSYKSQLKKHSKVHTKEGETPFCVYFQITEDSKDHLMQ